MADLVRVAARKEALHTLASCLGIPYGNASLVANAIRTLVIDTPAVADHLAAIETERDRYRKALERLRTAAAEPAHHTDSDDCLACVVVAATGLALDQPNQERDL